MTTGNCRRQPTTRRSGLSHGPGERQRVHLQRAAVEVIDPRAELVGVRIGRELLVRAYLGRGRRRRLGGGPWARPRHARQQAGARHRWHRGATKHACTMPSIRCRSSRRQPVCVRTGGTGHHGTDRQSLLEPLSVDVGVAKHPLIRRPNCSIVFHRRWNSRGSQMQAPRAPRRPARVSIYGSRCCVCPSSCCASFSNSGSSSDRLALTLLVRSS